MDDFSSKLDLPTLEQVGIIDVDHGQMTRYRSRSDMGYRAILGVLKQLLKSGDEDSGSVSDLSEASSFQSLPSWVSNSSSASIRDKYSKATEHLAALLSGDSVLIPIYDAATAKFGRERFFKNHDQLLKAFFKDLRSET